jgi:ATP-dependent DNA helicase RecQ
VRFVAHLDLPASMEAYYQETGRAGRDGQPANAWMLYSLSDVVAMRRLLDLSEGDEEFKRIQRHRREALLGYFGEKYPAPCLNCDNCSQAVAAWDGTVAAQKALSCVYRTGQRFGAAHLTDILVGDDNERIQRLQHHRIKTFGAGQDLSKTEWRSVYRQLLAAGMLSVNIGKISGYHLTEKSWQVLKGELQVRFRKDPRPVKKAKIKKISSKQPPELMNDAGRHLFEELRRLRLDISKERGVPPFVIFHDSTLTSMAAHRPKNREELLQISGIGERKAEQFGDAFLRAINADTEAGVGPY